MQICGIASHEAILPAGDAVARIFPAWGIFFRIKSGGLSCFPRDKMHERCALRRATGDGLGWSGVEEEAGEDEGDAEPGDGGGRGNTDEDGFEEHGEDNFTGLGGFDGGEAIGVMAGAVAGGIEQGCGDDAGGGYDGDSSPLRRGGRAGFDHPPDAEQQPEWQAAEDQQAEAKNGIRGETGGFKQQHAAPVADRMGGRADQHQNQADDEVVLVGGIHFAGLQEQDARDDEATEE